MREMFESHPQASHVNVEMQSGCVEACFRCEEVCTLCADACLNERDIDHLRRCIRLDLDCADVCSSLGRRLCRVGENDRDLMQQELHSTIAVVRACAEECQRHSGKHEHCRICAEVCHRCDDACNQLLKALPVPA